MLVIVMTPVEIREGDICEVISERKDIWRKR